jgi:hypothetical protein
MHSRWGVLRQSDGEDGCAALMHTAQIHHLAAEAATQTHRYTWSTHDMYRMLDQLMSAQLHWLLSTKAPHHQKYSTGTTDHYKL